MSGGASGQRAVVTRIEFYLFGGNIGEYSEKEHAEARDRESRR